MSNRKIRLEHFDPGGEQTRAAISEALAEVAKLEKPEGIIIFVDTGEAFRSFCIGPPGLLAALHSVGTEQLSGMMNEAMQKPPKLDS